MKKIFKLLSNCFLFTLINISLRAQVDTAVYFIYTGSDQYWTVPAGITQIQVKLWGAGGAGGNYVFNDMGGGGGFATATLTVLPSEQYKIIVGGGGQPGFGSGAYGGGGGKSGGVGGRGGGRSAIRDISEVELITAGGGGGGGGGSTDNNGAGIASGGAGGGFLGQVNSWPPFNGYPGTQDEGGLGGSNPDHGVSGASGSQFYGGEAILIDNGYNGSGGGGYFGGGGGVDIGDGGGGGGSSYIPSGGTTIGGNFNIPGNLSDIHYINNSGYGGQKGQSGNNGLIVILYNCSLKVWYRDFDNDGFGALNNSVQSCTAPAGYIADNTDCNDSNANIHPGALELCNNSIDDNCNGVVDETTQALPAEGLVAYYPFSGTANDVSGNNNNPVFNNATPATDRFGNTNSAYNFDGSSQYIKGPADNYPTGSRTVSIWFKATDLSFPNSLFGYGGNACGTSFIAILNHCMRPNALYSTQSHCEVNNCSTPNNPPAENDWYNWIITTQNNMTRFYINGSIIDSFAGVSFNGTYVPGKDFGIGVISDPGGVVPYADNCGNFFKGSLDDIVIYNRALDDDEVQQLYTFFNAPCSVMFTYYRDADDDGFGDNNNSLQAVAQPTGYVRDNTDCDDNQLFYTDADGDGFGSGLPIACGTVTNNTDCNDSLLLYTDADGDGYGSTNYAACGIVNNTDCDDSDPLVYVCQNQLMNLYGAAYYGTAYYGDGQATGQGTLYNLNADGRNFNLHHIFGIPVQGAYFMHGPLYQASDGKIYGLTKQTGISSVTGGTLFQYDIATNEYITKGFFQGSDLGELPNAGVIEYNGGLYGTCTQGGSLGYGTIFGYNMATSQLVISAPFDNSNGARPYGNLTIAPNGKMYGLAGIGGFYGKGTLFEFDPASNTISKKHDFNNTNGEEPYGSLVLASNGKMYGYTVYGGSANKGVIFEFNLSTKKVTPKRSFTGANGAKPLFNGMVEVSGVLYGVTSEGGTANKGVIFAYNPVANGLITKVYDFATSDGANPSDGLYLNINGMLYGTTAAGGAYGKGILFEFNPATRVLVKKKDFDGTNGATPMALMKASNGKIYGGTTYGGRSDKGVIFEYDITTNASTNKTGLDPAPGIYPFGSMTLADNGKLYGATNSGGDGGMGQIFEYDPVTKVYTVRFQFTDNLNQGNLPRSSLVKGPDGCLYGTTYFGGTNDRGVIFRFNPETYSYSVLHHFSNDNEGVNPYGSICFGANGKIYGTTRFGGINNVGVLFEFDMDASTYTAKTHLDTLGLTGSIGGAMAGRDGKIYAAGSSGGVGYGGLFYYDPSTGTSKVFHIFFDEDGKTPFGTLTQASNGKIYGMTKGGGFDTATNTVSNHGVIYEYDPQEGFTIPVHYFDGANGSAPWGELLNGSNGKLYGTTNAGGSFNEGVIFEFDPDTYEFKKIKDMQTAVTGNPETNGLTELPALPPTALTIDSLSSNLCSGDTIYIPVTASASDFYDGNTFSVELSNINGVFYIPSVIGSAETFYEDTIKAVIPLSTVPGTGYRIRLVSTFPYTMSAASAPLTISTGTIWYADNDGDGKGNIHHSRYACSQPAGFVADSSDCNDTSPLDMTASAAYTPLSCFNSTTILTVTVSNGVAPYSFSLNGGAPQTSNSFTVSAGTQHINVTDAGGCTAVLDTTIANGITKVPVRPVFTAFATTNLCGKSVIFSVTPLSNADSYNWVVPSGITIDSGQGTATLYVTVSGSFISGTVNVSASNSCGSGPTRSITVFGTPAKPVIAGPVNVLPNQTGLVYTVSSPQAGVVYSWVVPGGVTIVSGQGTSSVTLNWRASSGQIKVTGTNGCGNSAQGKLSVNVVVMRQPGITRAKGSKQKHESIEKGFLFPNPATSMVTVSFMAAKSGQFTISITDVEGRIVQVKSVYAVKGENRVSLNIAHLANGMYMVLINDDKKLKSSLRLIKQ